MEVIARAAKRAANLALFDFFAAFTISGRGSTLRIRRHEIGGRARITGKNSSRRGHRLARLDADRSSHGELATSLEKERGAHGRTRQMRVVFFLGGATRASRYHTLFAAVGVRRIGQRDLDALGRVLFDHAEKAFGLVFAQEFEAIVEALFFVLFLLFRIKFKVSEIQNGTWCLKFFILFYYVRESKVTYKNVFFYKFISRL